MGAVNAPTVSGGWGLVVSVTLIYISCILLRTSANPSYPAPRRRHPASRRARPA